MRRTSGGILHSFACSGLVLQGFSGRFAAEDPTAVLIRSRGHVVNCKLYTMHYTYCMFYTDCMTSSSKYEKVLCAHALYMYKKCVLVPCEVCEQLGCLFFISLLSPYSNRILRKRVPLLFKGLLGYLRGPPGSWRSDAQAQIPLETIRKTKPNPPKPRTSKLGKRSPPKNIQTPKPPNPAKNPAKGPTSPKTPQPL